jgi:hypothetical protein
VGLFIARLSKFGHVHYSLCLHPLWRPHQGEKQVLSISETTQDARRPRPGNAGAKDAAEWGPQGYNCGEAGLKNVLAVSLKVLVDLDDNQRDF